GTFRLYINNFLTMAIGGLWHGAAWKFVFWGAMHGVGLIVNKMCRPFTSRFDGKIWFSILSWAITLIFVSLLWVFFRAASWSDSCVIIASIFKDFSFDSISPFLHTRYLWVIMMSVIILSHCLSERWCDFISDLFVKSPWFFKFIVFIVVVQLVIELQSAEVAPFIYYQF
ncbi:MAG: MBOAT family protein, partial [Muribaculaceae bacterium]|nr:MBOAT family protein [Muribaculaceae bacterium]